MREPTTGKDTPGFSCILGYFQCFPQCAGLCIICHTFLSCFLHCAGNPLGIYAQAVIFKWKKDKTVKHISPFPDFSLSGLCWRGQCYLDVLSILITDVTGEMAWKYFSRIFCWCHSWLHFRYFSSPSLYSPCGFRQIQDLFSSPVSS